jgi:hypothetical protein
MRLGGRAQRGARRALIAHGGEATTMQMLEWCYRGPARDRRTRINRCRAVRRAAERLAVKLGRVWPGGNVWRLRG